MNATKLELYDNASGSNGLANYMGAHPRATSITPSDSDSGADDDRDGSRKRKRPMNVTYVLAPIHLTSDPLHSI